MVALGPPANAGGSLCSIQQPYAHPGRALSALPAPGHSALELLGSGYIPEHLGSDRKAQLGSEGILPPRYSGDIHLHHCADDDGS